MNFTFDVTRAGQTHQRGHALDDEDLHSAPPTSPDNAPPAHHHDKPSHVTESAARCDRRLCADGRGLPLPTLWSPVVRTELFCAVTPMDDRGRLADRSPIRAAGWRPGERVTISATRDRGLVIVRPGGREAITGRGHLRLPARIRRACRLSPGDRLLVASTTTPPLLVVYPMATLEAILRQRQVPASMTAETP